MRREGENPSKRLKVYQKENDEESGNLNLEGEEEDEGKEKEELEEEEDCMDVDENKSQGIYYKNINKKLQFLLFGSEEIEIRAKRRETQKEEKFTEGKEENENDIGNCNYRNQVKDKIQVTVKAAKEEKKVLKDIDEYRRLENGDLIRLRIPKYLFEKCQSQSEDKENKNESDKGKIIFGIDEAGRGPVLGPMVYGAAFWHSDDNHEIEKFGFNDSKVLNHSSRNDLGEKIVACEKIGWVSHSLSARGISQDMLSRDPTNLNELSFQAAAGMISKVLEKGLQVDEAYIDTVGPPDSYQRKFERHFDYLSYGNANINTTTNKPYTTTSNYGHTIDFTVAKKADSLYPVTSAASIVAKVTRDLSMKIWTWTEKQTSWSLELGSGYPADPNTSKWLKENTNFIFGLPDIARFSWATTKDILDDHCANVEWEADEEIPTVDPALIGVTRIDNLFGGGNAAKKKAAEERKQLRRCDYMIQKIGLDIEFD